MRKAFVTGGSGHLGANLVRLLLESGWRVRCLIHKDSKALKGLDIEKTHGNLTSASFLSSQMDGCDVVFHLAAYVAVEQSTVLMLGKLVKIIFYQVSGHLSLKLQKLFQIN